MRGYAAVSIAAPGRCDCGGDHASCAGRSDERSSSMSDKHADTKASPPLRTRRAAAPAKRTRRRLAKDARERELIDGAIAFFAERGFSGQTRELTRRLGVSKGLLYRYFPSKKALVDRIYEELFLGIWQPEWSRLIADRDRPLIERLKEFYLDYARLLHRYEWVRIYLHSGLAGASISRRFWSMVMERIYVPVIDELRHEFGRPSVAQRPVSEPELELLWSLHGSIFYIGVRKWVNHVPTPSDIEGAVLRLVDSLYANAAALTL
jgi:AcrR family transcriptional regulator